MSAAGEAGLHGALRAWAARLYATASLCATSRMALHPDLFLGGDVEDWRNHCSPEESALFDAGIAAGVLNPPEE